MNFKIGTYISLFLIGTFAIFYLISSNSLVANQDQVSLSPSFFPNIIAIILLVLCIISFFQTIKKESKPKIEMNNILQNGLTLLIIIIFILSWYYLQEFYLISFVFLFILFSIYRKLKSNKLRFFTVNGLLSLSTCLVLYLLFEITINVQL